MLIAFHPSVSNEQIEADEDLATVLDDLAFHVGSAMDGLAAAGVSVHYHAGDTVRLVAPTPTVWVRPADSADVGFLFVDAGGNRAAVFGVRTNVELVELATAFARAGRVVPP